MMVSIFKVVTVFVVVMVVMAISSITKVSKLTKPSSVTSKAPGQKRSLVKPIRTYNMKLIKLGVGILMVAPMVVVVEMVILLCKRKTLVTPSTRHPASRNHHKERKHLI